MTLTIYDQVLVTLPAEQNQALLNTVQGARSTTPTPFVNGNFVKYQCRFFWKLY